MSNGVKAKLREIAPSLPLGLEIATAYDRSWLTVVLICNIDIVRGPRLGARLIVLAKIWVTGSYHKIQSRGAPGPMMLPLLTIVTGSTSTSFGTGAEFRLCSYPEFRGHRLGQALL